MSFMTPKTESAPPPPPPAYTPTRADATAMTKQLNDPVSGFSAITNSQIGGALKTRSSAIGGRIPTATTGGTT